MPASSLLGKKACIPPVLWPESKPKEKTMYEQPSIHMELARQRHDVFLAEAKRAMLAGQVERRPSETVALVKKVAASLGTLLTRKQPVVVRQTQLQPTA